GGGLLRERQKVPSLGELVRQIGFVCSFQGPRMLACPLERSYDVHLVLRALLSQPLQEVQHQAALRPRSPSAHPISSAIASGAARTSTSQNRITSQSRAVRASVTDRSRSMFR